MDKINITYIDDRHDEILSRFLDKEYTNADYEISYCEVPFNQNEGYEGLIKNSDVVQSNIIIIDSRLFENATAGKSRFTGEEFKIILKKYYPFIEVIVITQNDADTKTKILAKYNSSCGMNGSEYYAKELPQHIDFAIDNITMYRKLAQKLENNDNWETILKNKIIDSLQGSNTYDELTKTDIDNLILAFKEIQVKLDG